ncbi:MAG: hypothetical protein ACP5E3_06745, partial [Bacteroidales bacterium]
MTDNPVKNKKSFKIGWYLLSMLFFLIAAIFLEKTYNQIEYTDDDIREFEQTLRQKEITLNQYLEKTENELDSLSQKPGKFAGFEEEFFNIYDQEGISVFFYANNQLKFWTDNQVPVPANLNLFPEERVLSLGNSIYVSKKVRTDIGTIIGLILIKTENPYENRFLQNGFQQDFKMDDNVQLIFSRDSLASEITDSKGDFLFSLDLESTQKISTLKKGLSLGAYFIFLLIFLTFIRKLVSSRDSRTKNIYVVGSMVFIVIAMNVLSYLQYPFIIFDLDLFSAIKYSSSFLFSSIGDLFAVIFLLFFIAYNFYADYIFSYKRIMYKKIHRYI